MADRAHSVTPVAVKRRSWNAGRWMGGGTILGSRWCYPAGIHHIYRLAAQILYNAEKVKSVAECMGLPGGRKQQGRQSERIIVFFFPFLISFIVIVNYIHIQGGRDILEILSYGHIQARTKRGYSREDVKE